MNRATRDVDPFFAYNWLNGNGNDALRLERMCTVDNRQLSNIVSALGGLGNIASATNCMTRLRVTVADENIVDEAAIRQDPAVLGLVHDQKAYYEIVVGPGKAKTYATALKDMLKDGSAVQDAVMAGAAGAAGAAAAGSASTPGTFSDVASSSRGGAALVSGAERSRGTEANDAEAQRRKPSLGAQLKHFCKVLGGIFVPLIPGFITSGICGSFAMIIQQLVPGYADSLFWGCLYNLLYLIQQSLLAYLTAWTGYRAAEQFGGTPILGGMLGMITSMDNINDIATLLGLYNADTPLSSVLMAGKGGVLAVVIGVFLLVKIEHLVDGHMPDVLKVVGTPLVTMLVCTALYVLAIMPAAGFLASWLCDGMDDVCLSQNVFVRVIAGYVSAALFLPLVAVGMHHGLVALYAIQLQAVGYVTLYPALCMAGAGQVGAALAIRHKARLCGNTKVMSIADAGIPAGFLGVGEPLVYGLTLPMGKPFITAGLGAGFGGAFVMFMQVAATSWGPSGLLGLCVMDAGPNGMAASLGAYAIGLLISYVMGFAITNVAVKTQDVAELYREDDVDAQLAAAGNAGEAAEDANASSSAEELAAGGSESEAAAGPSVVHGQYVAIDGMIVQAPADGQLIAQKDIADKTFHEGYLGSCFGIAPSEDDVYAPCDGTVALETDTYHALVIETPQGREVMIHIGLGTVAMQGAGFEPLVRTGDSVSAGQLLMRFDRALVRANGYQDTVITALLNQ